MFEIGRADLRVHSGTPHPGWTPLRRFSRGFPSGSTGELYRARRSRGRDPGTREQRDSGEEVGLHPGTIAFSRGNPEDQSRCRGR